MNSVFPFAVGDILRVTNRTKQGTEVYTVKVTGFERKQYHGGNVHGWYVGYVPSGLPDSVVCGFGYSWLFDAPMEYGIQKAEHAFCGTMLSYLFSEFKSTKLKMQGLTTENLVFVDSAYRLAQQHYERGGDAIAEAMTPWEVLQTFETLDDVAEYMALRHDHETDIRGA